MSLSFQITSSIPLEEFCYVASREKWGITLHWYFFQLPIVLIDVELIIWFFYIPNKSLHCHWTSQSAQCYNCHMHIIDPPYPGLPSSTLTPCTEQRGLAWALHSQNVPTNNAAQPKSFTSPAKYNFWHCEAYNVHN